jgi:hypothetical protein
MSMSLLGWTSDIFLDRFASETADDLVEDRMTDTTRGTRSADGSFSVKIQSSLDSGTYYDPE